MGLAKPMLVNLFLAGAAAADPVSVLAFGDSLTQGYGLPTEAGFVPQMQAWLNDQGADVHVINAGVSGDTTAGGAARIGWSLSKDVDAVIVALGGNDMLRGIDPATVRKNLATILNTIDARSLPVLVVGQEAPGNYGADYKADFEANYQSLADQYDATLFPNFLQGLVEVDDRSLVMQRYMQGDRLHPNAAGVALIVARMGPAVLKLVQAVQKGP